jgi:hypothetical protein
MYSWVSMLNPCADAHTLGIREAGAAVLHLTTEPIMN